MADRVPVTNTDDIVRKKKLDPKNNVTPTTDAGQVQRAIDHPSPETLTPDVVNSLQTSHGNQFVNRLVQRMDGTESQSKLSSPIQFKLTVTPAGDQYEQEADKVASQVVQNIQSGDVQRADEDELQMQRIQRAEEDELQMQRIQRADEDELQMQRIQRADEDEMMMQRIQRAEEDEMMMKRIQRAPLSFEDGGDVDSGVEGAIESARGSGQSLPDQVRTPMESAFNADFSNVRVHTDNTSDSLNNAVQAKAFTTGQDIFFRKGEFSPSSSGGQQLLAHELTHVVQQNGASIQKKDKDE